MDNRIYANTRCKCCGKGLLQFEGIYFKDNTMYKKYRCNKCKQLFIKSTTIVKSRSRQEVIETIYNDLIEEQQNRYK